MVDYGDSRTDYYDFLLVDPMTLQETGETVQTRTNAGNITFATSADNRYSAQFKFAQTLNTNRLVRVKHVVETASAQESETLGTFFLDGTTISADKKLLEVSCDGYSTLYRFTQDTLAQDFSRPKGYNVVQEVKELIEADGGIMRTLPGVNTEQLHTIDVWWEVGTNRASVLEQIAGWTNAVLDVDGNGYVTWGPYLDPMQRAVEYTFEDGINCVYLPGVDISDTRADAVNRVVAHFSRETKQDDPSKDNYDPYPLSDSVFVDLPDYDAYSYRVIGRRKTYDMDVSEPCSHDDLIAQATRYLYEHSGNVTYYQIEHLGVCNLRPGARVHYINSNDFEERIDCDCVVEEISMTLDKLCRCKTKLRRL